MAGNQLSVKVRDGRGEVLAVDGEKTVPQLEAQDFQQFEAARELLERHSLVIRGNPIQSVNQANSEKSGKSSKLSVEYL